MKRIVGAILTAGFLACCTFGYNPVKGQEGSIVDLDGMKAAVPATWKEEKPTNTLRYKQFRLPKVKGDAEDAEVVIFKLGGTPEANLKRWKEQFIPPEGKKIDEVAKVTEMKIGGRTAFYLDIEGTYKSKERPFDPQSKEIRKSNTRMVAIQIEGKADPYQIRLVGPAATVGHFKKGFDEWIKAYK